MRGKSVLLILAWAAELHAGLPLYYFPGVIRGEQLLWHHQMQDRPDAKVQFMGPFGLHPLASARFGWSEVACLDSAQAFHLAETIWLDYYCTFADSAIADLALVVGPIHVNRMEPSERNAYAKRLQAVKQNPKLGLVAVYHPRGSTGDGPLEEARPNLADIPKFTSYKVQPGDSLWKIHQKFPQHSMAQLMEANGGKETIYAGQILQIPL